MSSPKSKVKSNSPSCGHTTLDKKCKECKALQKKWATKLESSGFEDQEHVNGGWFYHNERSVHFESRDVILKFFLKLDSWLHTADITRKHRRILELYSDGKFINSDDGIAIKVKLNEKTVRTIIEKYKKLIQALPDEPTDEGQP